MELIMSEPTTPLVAVIMGSRSDWETMREAARILSEFQVPHESHVMSAHRTPDVLADFAMKAESRGLEVIIAGAGGAAHLAGVTAAHTVIPVIGVPIESQALKGMDSLLSTVQMPAGIPVATVAIGVAGAKNAALLAISILSNARPALREKLHAFRQRQRERILGEKLEE
jgi:5-(carboxyamino)imidazole ribonucleotide mutase